MRAIEQWLVLGKPPNQPDPLRSDVQTFGCQCLSNEGLLPNPMANLKLALRTLFKTPFVTAVAVLSLALGIGANAAIFSLFNQMLLRPLPVPKSGNLVNLTAPDTVNEALSAWLTAGGAA